MYELNKQYAAWARKGFGGIDGNVYPELAAFAFAVNATHPGRLSALIAQYAHPDRPNEFTLGFAFTPSSRVVLVKKELPTWQKGRWNGVGGRIEPAEGFMGAMRREFREETGVDHADWRLSGLLVGDDWRVFVMTAISEAFYTVKTMTDEEIALHPTGGVKVSPFGYIENLPALISLCQISASEPSGIPPFFTMKY